MPKRRSPDEKPRMTVEITAPQFHREQGAPPVGCPPATKAEWGFLRGIALGGGPKAVGALKEMGLRAWNDPKTAEPGDERFEGGTLMLFPGEWYHHIPKGFTIVDIFGNEKTFAIGQTDDDIRFGCLAYGLVVRP